MPFRHLFWGMSRLWLNELAITCPLRLKPGLEYLDRKLETVGKPLPETLLFCFVLKMFISLDVHLPVVL